MPTATLVIRAPNQPEQQLILAGGASIGRAPDNSICIDDANLSRYHAVIELRGNSFLLTDLGSANGTAINGEPVTSDYRLLDGDVITLGGVSDVEFRSADARRPAENAAPEQPIASPEIQKPLEPKASRLNLVVISIAIGLVVTVLAALLLSGVMSGSGAVVRIANPITGSTINGPFEVRLQTDNSREIARITVQLDGQPVATRERPPFDVRIDPSELRSRLPSLGVGTHVLSVTAEKKDGAKFEVEPQSVLLAFDLKAATASGPSENPPSNGSSSNAGPITPPEARATIDVATAAQGLAAQISGKRGYVFDQRFVSQIELKINEFQFEFGDDALRNRRVTCQAFQNQGLSPLIGFVMAMSESKFKESGGTAAGLGLWRMPVSVVVERGDVAPEQAPDVLSDPKKAANIVAAYISSLNGVFVRQNFMYSVACYGMSLKQAGEIRTALEATNDPAGRDFWSMVERGIIPPEGANRVIRFFAAGIVGENPQAYNLRSESLSLLC